MKSISRRKAVLGGVALCSVAGISRAAFANGDDFFGADEVPGKPIFVYFGTVKSDTGKYLDGVEVTMTITEPPMVLVVYTDILGRFRTLDAGRTLSDMGYTTEINSKNFKVGVATGGYRQIRQLNRAPANAKPGAAYEMNFIMTKDESMPEPPARLNID